ncbi:MAG: hypothetical protein HYX34_06945 [Actinobacteria bacterium]|nr:hypothetical protein [Actinomycetota bacterium]
MIGFIVFGLVVGALARLIVPGRQAIGLWLTLLVGVIGSVVGGIIANALGTGTIFELNLLGSVVAILTATVLVVLVARVSHSRAGGGHHAF